VRESVVRVWLSGAVAGLGWGAVGEGHSVGADAEGCVALWMCTSLDLA